MNDAPRKKKADQSPATALGRPTEAGSHQQTVPNQNSQSGCDQTDREATRGNEWQHPDARGHS